MEVMNIIIAVISVVLIPMISLIASLWAKSQIYEKEIKSLDDKMIAFDIKITSIDERQRQNATNVEVLTTKIDAIAMTILDIKGDLKVITGAFLTLKQDVHGGGNK